MLRSSSESKPRLTGCFLSRVPPSLPTFKTRLSFIVRNKTPRFSYVFLLGQRLRCMALDSVESGVRCVAGMRSRDLGRGYVCFALGRHLETASSKQLLHLKH